MPGFNLEICPLNSGDERKVSIDAVIFNDVSYSVIDVIPDDVFRRITSGPLAHISVGAHYAPCLRAYFHYAGDVIICSLADCHNSYKFTQNHQPYIKMLKNLTKFATVNIPDQMTIQEAILIYEYQ